MRGAKPGMKKCRRGKGTLGAIFQQEVNPRMSYHVDGELPQISVQLAGESEKEVVKQEVVEQ